MTTRRGRTALAALAAAAAILIVVELALGSLHFGETKLADPCTAKPPSVDGVIQRLGLSALNGAACELGATREELVLSFVPSAGTKPIRWDKETIDRALRSGFDRAAKDVAGNGILGGVLAFVLREALTRPIEWFLGRT